MIGLNIGCGTPDAVPKRPPLDVVADAVQRIAAFAPSVLLLTGAPFERAVNAEFVRLYRARHGDALPIVDAAGDTALSGLTGLIDLCDLFISSDSGPYHMAVAMRKPTVAWFMLEEPTATHDETWCRCLLRPSADQVAAAASELLAS